MPLLAFYDFRALLMLGTHMHAQLSWEWPGDSVLCNMRHEASSPGFLGPGEEASLCSFSVLCAI